ncbi:uncharacterized protein LOC129318937 [Prosopis cineraria]|uniref:uncharacterized protein LOC129318937 n=1 Tax=Prosopis cineraria TaxID=364024 RepID=UPI0024101066|nr:uncharacterized protein LOC129318937 [Prosopis cineraria]
MAANHNSKMKTTMMCQRPDHHLTRQPSSLSNYEGYHGDETASVPFTWEWQPGTPKHQFRETTLPPLTPPPSYYSHASSSTPKSFVKARKSKNFPPPPSKSNLLQSIFPKRAARKARAADAPPLPPSPPANSSPSLSFSSSSTSSSSSYQSWQRSRSVPSTPMRYPGKEKEDEEDLFDAPVSGGMCFGNAGFRGFYSSMIKKVMLGDFL